MVNATLHIMITKKFWMSSLVVSSLFVACGDKDDPDDPDYCPDGTLECECLEDYSCEGALVCESGFCVQPSGSGGGNQGTGGNGDGDGDGEGTGGSYTATGGNGNGSGGDQTGDGDGDGTGGEESGDGDGEGGLGGLGGGPGDGDGDGSGGDGTGGDGGGDEVECEDGCALLTVPFTAFNTKTPFFIQYTPDIDLTNAVVTARVFVEMEGNSGGIQLFAQNGGPNYSDKYHGWSDFYTLTSDWVDLTLDLSAIADPDSNGFSKSQVVWIGFNLAVTDSWGSAATVGTVKVYVEDITFTAGADDVTFATDLEGLQVNPFVTTVPGSSVALYP